MSGKRSTGTYNFRSLPFLQKTLGIALTLLVLAFVSMYPYLGVIGVCDDGGCPQISQTSYGHTQLSGTVGTNGDHAAALISALLAVAAPLILRISKAGDRSRAPEEPYLSPPRRPPQPVLSFFSIPV